MVILGVDPGLNATGFGVIEIAPTAALCVLAAGALRPSRALPLAERLAVIHRGLTELIRRHRPETMVLEQLFTHSTYVSTAARMAHARGVACLAAQEARIQTAEYAPARAKQAITGTGAATKAQVARMVEHWLGRLDPTWSQDATDALALAIVHAQISRRQRRLPAGMAGHG